MKPMVVRMLLRPFSRTGYRGTVLSPDNVPAEGQFLRVDTLPLRATDKHDLRTVRDLATRISAEKPNQQPGQAEVRA